MNEPRETTGFYFLVFKSQRKYNALKMFHKTGKKLALYRLVNSF